MIENYVKTILKLYEQYIKDYYQDKINMIIESGKGKVVIKTRVCLLLRDGKIRRFLMGDRLYFLCFKGSDKGSKR